MITSVNMVRKMGNFEVIQRTKDCMFNATNLAKQWHDLTGQRKDTTDFLRINSTKEYISVIQEENQNTGIPVFTKSVGKNGGVWMHPFLFIDFSMWLNPKFKLQVIKFVYDQLIEFRHSAGDYYKLLHKSGAKLKGYDFVKVAKGLNHIVFGKHESGILRNKATESQLKELSELQQKLSFAIDMGYIDTFDKLLSEMRKLWHKKQNEF